MRGHLRVRRRWRINSPCDPVAASGITRSVALLSRKQARARHALESYLRRSNRTRRVRRVQPTSRDGGTAMKIVTAAEMPEIDRVTSDRFHVPSLTLMENAGTAVADFVLSQYPWARRIGG